MGKKLYTFKCGCQAAEPKLVEFTVRGRFCPTCFDVNKDHTSQYKCRIQSLVFECEQCGKPQQRNSGATQVFLCHNCQHERQQKKVRQKLAEKRIQAQQEREREEQERQCLEQERLALIKRKEQENAELKAKLASLEQERLAQEQERQRQERERLVLIKRKERENAELKAKLASLEAKPPVSAPAPVESIKTPNQGGTKKTKAKCPRCEKEHTLKVNMEFNTRTTRWLFCPACALVAKNSGIPEVDF